jgi:glycerophosphoryl diester phosphodiesterase
MTNPRIGWLAGLTIAHRGLHDMRLRGGWVENSRAAFNAALAAGYPILCDVRLAADGQPVVFRDAKLDRITHAKGDLSGYPASVLGRIPLAGSRDTVLRLDQVLALVAGQVPLLLELRAEGAKPEPLCEAVSAQLAHYPGLLAVLSARPDILRWFAQHHDDAPRGLVVACANSAGWRGFWLRLRARKLAQPDCLAVDLDALSRRSVARFVHQCRAAGLAVAAYTACNDEQRALALHHGDAVIAEGAGLG